MGRTDPQNSTDRSRAGGVEGYDYCAQTAPSTIADQLRNQGYLRPNMPQGSDGPVLTPPRYPLAGNAGFDTDHDADDYNSAVYQTTPQSTTSSSGP